MVSKAWKADIRVASMTYFEAVEQPVREGGGAPHGLGSAVPAMGPAPKWKKLRRPRERDTFRGPRNSQSAVHLASEAPQKGSKGSEQHRRQTELHLGLSGAVQVGTEHHTRLCADFRWLLRIPTLHVCHCSWRHNRVVDLRSSCLGGLIREVGNEQPC